MKYTWAVVVALCLVVSGAWASGLGFNTARSLGMGGAVNAVADDAAAWFQNPAGLANLNAPAVEGKTWGNDIMLTYSKLDSGSSDVDGWGLTWSGWQPEKAMGVGAGYVNSDYESMLGAGFGMALKNSPLSWGVNVVNHDPDSGDSSTIFNIGLMYKFMQEDKAPVRVALMAEDITDEWDEGVWFNLGVLWPVTEKVSLAVDVDDVTDQSDSSPFFSAGAECTFGTNNEWTGRVGVMDTGEDHELTAGVGYAAKNWKFAFGYADIADGQWAVSASTGF